MFTPGDLVETIFTPEECLKNQKRDSRKALKSGKTGRKTEGPFVGRAASYMHTDEAYKVLRIERGGVRLEGFAPLVSTKHLRLSTKQYLGRKSWWL